MWPPAATSEPGVGWPAGTFRCHRCRFGARGVGEGSPGLGPTSCCRRPAQTAASLLLAEPACCAHPRCSYTALAGVPILLDTSLGDAQIIADFMTAKSPVNVTKDGRIANCATDASPLCPLRAPPPSRRRPPPPSPRPPSPRPLVPFTSEQMQDQELHAAWPTRCACPTALLNRVRKGSEGLVPPSKVSPAASVPSCAGINLKGKPTLISSGPLSPRPAALAIDDKLYTWAQTKAQASRWNVDHACVV